MSQPLTIASLCEASYANAEAKGFHPAEPPEPTSLGEALQVIQELRGRLRTAYFFQRLFLIISEVVEAGEDWRKGLPAYVTEYGPGGKPNGIPSELADVFIRLGDTCKEFGVPIEAAIAEKMSYNSTREHMHGKKA